MKLRLVVFVSAACVLAASCDQAAFLSATVALPGKLDYRQIAKDQSDLQSELNSEAPGTDIGRAMNWRVNGDIPDWDRTFMCDEPKVLCSSIEPKHYQGQDGLYMSYGFLKSQYIQFHSDGKSLEYYFSGAPARVAKGTRWLILELGRRTAKKYNRPSFKVCRGDAGDECYDESVRK
jgi:hypothetical protein